MAQAIINGHTYALADGSLLATVCGDAGIPINCNTGVCGACLIEVVQGRENLNALTEEELDLGLSGRQRLACQCVILGGTVEIQSP